MKTFLCRSEWMNDCLTPNEKPFFSYVKARTSYIQWNDDGVRFVLDQHDELDCYSASSLKQPSVDRNVAPLGYIILIPIQPCLVEKQQVPMF